MAETQVVATGKISPVIVRVPGWEQYPWLQAGFSTRYPGASKVYGEGELNLGLTNEDDASKFARNPQAFLEE